MPGTVIKKIREDRHLTQEYVAQKMGISQNAYSKIENNITQLTINHLKKISEILDVSVNDLLKDDFEIYKPIDVSKDELTKENLLILTDHLKDKILSKESGKNQIYTKIMALYKKADDLLTDVI
ncbi:MAG TPA: helix-turn-helix transcriptional regulator [Chitinophagaceae bacterium]|nr:helix-turn-helix transcriptional regulator [Chitinophagaceae bacterium]